MATIVSLLVGALVGASVARFGARGAASNGRVPWWNVVLRSMAW